jgi:hypothetical protein
MSDSAKSLKAQSRFAIECRKVRLFIATKPGASSFEIKQSVGFKPDFHLMKMIGMGIVKSDGPDGPYFVVPQ